MAGIFDKILRRETGQAEKKPINMFERQDALFAEIEMEKKNIPREDLIILISRIFEHSFNDGRELANRIGLTPSELLACVGTPEFILKQGDATELIANDLRHVGEEDERLSPQRQDEIDWYKVRKTVTRKNIAAYKNPIIDEARPVSETAQKIYWKIDDQYKEYLRIIKVKAEAGQESTFSTEEVAENHLVKVQRAFDHMYYAGDVARLAKELLAKYEYDEDKVEKVNSILEKYKRSYFISESDIEVLVAVLDVEGEDTWGDFSKSRYRLNGELFSMEKGVIKHELLSRIKKSLNARDAGEVSFNQATGEYQYKQNELKEAITETELIKDADQITYPAFIKGLAIFEVDAAQGKKFEIFKVDGSKIEWPLKDEEVIKVVRDEINGEPVLIYSTSNGFYVGDNEGELISKKISGKPAGFLLGSDPSNPLARALSAVNNVYIYDLSGQLVVGGYEKVFDVETVEGQTFFSCEDNKKQFYVDGKGVAVGGKHEKVGILTGQLFLASDQNGQKYLASETGKALTGKYKDLIHIDGSQVLFSKDENILFDFDRNIIKSKHGGRLHEVKIDNDSKKYYRLVSFGRDKVWVDQEDQVVGKEFAENLDLHLVDGQPFVEWKGKDKTLHLANRHGEDVLSGYDSVTQNAGFFVAEKNGMKTVFNLDGEEITGECDNVIINKLSKVYITAKKGGKEMLLNESGEIISDKYAQIITVEESGSGIVLRVKDGKKLFYVNLESGKQVSQKFDRIFPSNFNNETGEVFVRGVLGDKNGLFGKDGMLITERKVPEVWQAGKKTYFLTLAGRGQDVVDEKGKIILSEKNTLGFEYFKEKNIAIFFSDNGTRLYDEGGRPINGEFSSISSLEIVGDELVIFDSREDTNGKHNVVTVRVKLAGLNKGLNDSEQKYLELLNLVQSPESRNITNYFLKNGIGEKLPEMELAGVMEEGGEFNVTPFVLNFFNEDIKVNPDSYIGTVAAKPFTGGGKDIEQFLAKLFPELHQEKKGLRGKVEDVIEKIKKHAGRGLSLTASPAAYLTPKANSLLAGGGKEQISDRQEVLSFRDPIHSFVPLGIYGSYDNKDNKWGRHYFSLDKNVPQPKKETTGTIQNSGKLSEIILPIPLSAELISQRVKGVTADGEEFPVQVEINSLGEAVATGTKNFVKILYSIEHSPVDELMKKIDTAAYQGYKGQFEKAHGGAMSEKFGKLPEELKIFVSSIESYPPVEKVKAIENFVRSIGYYDMDNSEIAGDKIGLPPSEQLKIMENRLQELREKVGEKAANKKYAGVCADFAMLTTALLREAGFASGIMEGFQAKGKTISVGDAHALSFVVWPNDKLGNSIFTVDGTPSGVALVSLPSLEEREKLTIEQTEEIKKQAKEELKKIFDVVASQDEEAIKKLSSGTLEKTMNVILEHEVEEQHLKVVSRVLEAFWYSPANSLELNDPASLDELTGFFTGQIQQERERPIKEGKDYEGPGSYMFKTVKEFSEKFIRSKKVETTEQAFDLIEKIFTLAGSELNGIEKRAIASVVTYLRAKKMAG